MASLAASGPAGRNLSARSDDDGRLPPPGPREGEAQVGAAVAMRSGRRPGALTGVPAVAASGQPALEVGARRAATR